MSRQNSNYWFGGGNAVQHIINSGVEGVEYILPNTDAQALSMFKMPRLKLGKDITKGLGAGNNLKLEGCN